MNTLRRWIIGRAPDCDIVVNETAVSSRHCCLTQTAGGFEIADLQSSNGTFVNGRRIGAQPIAVSAKDRVTLGTQVLLPWPDAGPSSHSSMPPGRPAQVAPSAARPPAQAPPATARVAQPTPSTAGLNVEVLTIGRAPENDIVLDFPAVSNRHARLTLFGSRMEIEDLGSSNGTALGHPNAKIQGKKPMSPQDVLFFGSLRQPVQELLQRRKMRRDQSVSLEKISLDGGSLLFGRDPSCDRVLSYSSVSARHARLKRTPQGLILEDLGSTNGTYVNGIRIHGMAEIKPGDEIGLGSYRFTLAPGDKLTQRDLRQALALEARAINVDVPKRRLLDGVSFTVHGGEFVGLMGPSGAGKSTLMGALNGYTKPSAGQVLVNGQDLYTHFDLFRQCIGYVPQDDVIHHDLTVQQALYFSARLRLPEDYTREHIFKRMAEVLEQLGLRGTERTLIKRVSGGQRKRVNLAMELFTDPLILFLDEPTSGLSSEDAVLVMKLLREIANTGKLILLTIHQPSLEAYKYMDNLAMVGRDPNSTGAGQLVYYGPAYPDAIQFLNPDRVATTDPSPDELLSGLKGKPTAVWSHTYQRSKYRQQYVIDRASVAAEAPSKPADKPRPANIATQLGTLILRSLARKWADRMGTWVLCAQAPVFACLLVMVFHTQMAEAKDWTTTTAAQDLTKWPDVSRSVSSILLTMTMASFWFGSTNSIREVVGEWSVYQRERMVNLRLPAYLGAKFLVLVAMNALQVGTLLVIVYFGCHLKGPFVALYAVLLLASFCGVVLGLLLSSASRTTEVAVAILPVVMLVLMVFNGGTQAIHRMPVWLKPIAHLSPSRWAFEGMMMLETAEYPSSPAVPPAKSVDMAEDAFPKDDHRTSPVLAVFVLLVEIALGLACILGTLRYRDLR